jgi:CheY-like chemotaxis protein
VTRRIRDTPQHGDRKPRVLLVDDHRQVLKTVAAMLAVDFDVVAAATDGAQAIETAADVNPDVIVMDIEMPGLDGFQTARALKRDGLPDTPVVFLSMHGADEVVSEAFRCGGRGYVLKQRVGRDLVHALDQALRGRSFVPSLAALSSVDAGGHVMQLYDGVESFVDGLAILFDLALRRGDATCVIANRPVREGLSDRLRARGWAAGGSSGHKRYLAIDAADALSRFMRNGLPDPDRLADLARELDAYRRAESEGAGAQLTVCGNMVVSLSEDGNAPAVIALERLWNELTRHLPFLTLCGYTSCCFPDGAPGLWSAVCTEHRALSHAHDV